LRRIVEAVVSGMGGEFLEAQALLIAESFLVVLVGYRAFRVIGYLPARPHLHRPQPQLEGIAQFLFLLAKKREGPGIYPDGLQISPEIPRFTADLQHRQLSRVSSHFSQEVVDPVEREVPFNRSFSDLERAHAGKSGGELFLEQIGFVFVELSEVERSIFYSSWLYSAVRLFTSVSEEGKTVDEITAKFLQPRQRIVSILGFLVSAGLVVQEKDRYRIGPLRTFVEQGSPHLARHHANWRSKAIQKSDHVSEKELMFTSPVSLSRADFEKIREQIAELLKSVSTTVKASPAEDIACLNVDFFWVER
jgi:hypothetical protein